MAYNVLQSITILANMLRVFTERCVAGITANVERCRLNAESTIALATALNPVIGYAKAAELVKESVASGRSIVALAREKKLMSEAEIDDVLNPMKMTEPRVAEEGSR
jgi:aspartate ammonia-lyase